MKKTFKKSLATADRILVAAERLFAAHGFDGVSMRGIAAEGDAQLALIHYHFGSKLDLYRAVWEKRFRQPELRQAKLEKAEIDLDRPRAAVVRELVELFVRAPMALLNEPGGRDFLVIIGRELTDPKEAERGVLQEFVGPTTQLFLSAFQKVLPELTQDEVALGFRYMTGVTQGRLSGFRRPDKTTTEEQRIREVISTWPAMTEFIVGGWLQLREMKLSQMKLVPVKKSSRK